MDETAKALECAGATCATVDEAQCCVEALKLALPSNHRQQQTCEAGFEAKKFTCANGVAESPESISCSSAECGEEDVDACCKEAPAATSGHETCLQGVEAKRICQATGSVHPEVTTDNMRADVKALHCGAEECTSDDEAQCCVSFTSCGAIKTENACGLQASEGHQCVWTQKKKDEMLKIEANGCPDRGVPPFCPRVWENDGAEQCLDCGALTDIYGGGLIDGLDYCAGQSDGKCELTRQVRCQGLVMSNGWSEGE
ncbi:unnamed protein product [Amoebophrya sp. A120]|nr:unnamed protein product [Amoebophrya sp. A120]|eukprot:GSA120T00009983001.1